MHPIARSTRGLRMETALDTDGGQVIATPLRADLGAVGALSLHFDEVRDLDGDERDLLSDFASAAARALEQTRLFAEVDAARAQAERERSRVEAQRELSVRLSRAATAEEAADIVLRRAIAITSSVAGGVALAHEDGYLEFVAVRGLAGDDAERMPRFAFDDLTASTEALRSGQESFAPTAEAFLARYPDGYRVTGGPGRGVWALPLVVQGAPIGVVMLILDSERLPSEDDRSTVRALAAQVGQALRRAQTSDQTREAAEELQRAMLPVELPAVPGTAVTGLYRAATQILEVGGDWYDAVETAPDAIAVAVGDVVGRGVPAAATMGQLRVAWRALALRSEGPAVLLSSLDRFARDLPGAEVTTVACASLDVRTGQLRYACAGHLPPLVVSRAGDAGFLDEGRSVPLAVGQDAVRSEGLATLHAGDTLVLYSDGLVERRDEPMDEGLERLRRAAEQIGGPRGELADALEAALVDRDRSLDDVAILTLTLLPTFRASLTDAHDLAPLRASLRAWLDERAMPDEVAEELVMASGEALANAIEHAGSNAPVEIRGWVDESSVGLRITDRGTWMPGEPSPDRGHGLTIMRALMDEVEVHTDELGTSVELRRSRGLPLSLT